MIELKYGGSTMTKHIEKMKEFYKNNKKSSFTWYLILRGLVILIMILRF